MNKSFGIWFDESSKRYTTDQRDLSCGVTLELQYDHEWYVARIEYSDNFDGYYAILYKDEKVVDKVSLKYIAMGKWL